MGESATDVVAEIERIRGRIGADVQELRTKMPDPKRVGVIAGAALGGLLAMRWLVSRRRTAVLVPLAAGVAGGFALAKRRFDRGAPG